MKGAAAPGFKASCACVPGPPKVPEIMAQYPKRERIGSIGSIILGIFGGPGSVLSLLIPSLSSVQKCR